MRGGPNSKFELRWSGYNLFRVGLFLLVRALYFSNIIHAAIPCSDYLHQIWRTEDGLPNPVVKVVMQSHAGYLRLGTDEDLARFDGVRFREFERKTVTEKSDRWLVGLIEATDGSIWSSSING